MNSLEKITDRVYYFPFDDDKDRPVLGYIRGDRFSVAVDAGHSAEHVADFYRAIKMKGLPEPALTVITHWHWDHTFGMHAVKGKTMASRRTNAHLRQIIATHDVSMTDLPAAGAPAGSSDTFTDSDGALLARLISLDEHVATEYAGGQQVIVKPADIEFEDFAGVDAGGVEIDVTEAVSPHTDDTTFVYIPQERVLFTGDAVMGEWPSRYIDPDKMKQLIAKVGVLDFDVAVTGHWPPCSKEQLLADLKANIYD